ncbi:MAG: glycosyltransferase N-terminal domain-containing protein, partial [Rikenellaceae bacterium]
MIFYNLLMRIISLLSPFFVLAGGKTKLWVKGRKGLIKKTEELFKDKKEDVIWFHCASLGEFEQGRQLIEEIRGDYP